MFITNFLILIFVISVQAGDIIVDTVYGKVKGEQSTTILGKKNYFSFKGIPYTEPPIGDLRFKVNNVEIRN